MDFRVLFSFLLFFHFLSVTVLEAQTVVSGKITGSDGAPLPYVGIVVHQLPDSIVLTTTVADSMGRYRIEFGKNKGVFVRAVLAGYISVAQKVIEGGKVQVLDFVLYPASHELRDVSVISAKPLIERQVDRVVFNVENSLSAIGTDALEVISKAPGVIVSGDDAISLAGKSSVNVMIDGRLQQLDGEELAEVLHAMPGDQIALIEVITTPPAKYDAAGNSGMINIVTKKIKKDGLNGSVGVSYVRNSMSSTQPEGVFNYRRGPWNVYGNSSGGENYSRPIERQFTPTGVENINQVTHTDNLNNYHRSQLGVDYNVSARAVIGVLYTYGGSTPKKWEQIDARFTNPAGGLDSGIATAAHTSTFGERNVVNVNYELHIDSTGKKLNVDGDFFTRTGRTVRDFSNAGYYDGGNATGTQSTDKTTGRQVLYISSAKGDLELPITHGLVSLGAKASFLHVVSDNVFQYVDSRVYVTDAGKSNAFDYKENTQAVYLSARRKMGQKLECQAGMRAEYTQTTAHSLTNSEVHHTEYLKLFPTAYVQYKASEDHVLNLNYSRRIDRPNMSMINPFRRYATPNNYETGNPFLQPAFTTNLELSYTLKSRFTFTVFSQYVEQINAQVLQIDSARQAFHFTYSNIGTSLSNGASFNCNLQPLAWWECNVQLYGFVTDVHANFYAATRPQTYRRTGMIAEGENNFTLNKNKTILAAVGFEYLGAMVEDYNLKYPATNINAGFKVLLLKKTLIFGMHLNDIFATAISKTKNLYNGAISDNYYDERSLHLNATWKFGNKHVEGMRERKTSAVDSR